MSENLDLKLTSHLIPSECDICECKEVELMEFRAKTLGLGLHDYTIFTCGQGYSRPSDTDNWDEASPCRDAPRRVRGLREILTRMP